MRTFFILIKDKFENINTVPKFIFGLITIIVLLFFNAIGSGLWKYFLEPAFFYIGYLFYNCISVFSELYSNNLYYKISQNDNQIFSSILFNNFFILIIAIFIFLFFIPFIEKILNKHWNNKLQNEVTTFENKMEIYSSNACSCDDLTNFKQALKEVVIKNNSDYVKNKINEIYHLLEEEKDFKKASTIIEEFCNHIDDENLKKVFKIHWNSCLNCKKEIAKVKQTLYFSKVENIIKIVFTIIISVLVCLNVINYIITQNYIHSAVIYYNQSLDIAKPYLTQKEILLVKSEFAQIESKDDYVEIINKLKKTADHNNIKLKKFNIW